MELTIERIDIERNCEYTQNIKECPEFIMREAALDYTCAMMLLRNIGERKDTTSLEREAISAAVRLLKRNIDNKQQ